MSTQQRTVRLELRPNREGRNALIAITVRSVATEYFVDAIPADFGRGFSVQKLGVYESYQVNLSDRPSCTCKGHCRWGTPCKHILALSALVNAGKL
jgi:hypothetical protein